MANDLELGVWVKFPYSLNGSDTSCIGWKGWILLGILITKCLFHFSKKPNQRFAALRF